MTEQPVVLTGSVAWRFRFRGRSSALTIHLLAAGAHWQGVCPEMGRTGFVKRDDLISQFFQEFVRIGGLTRHVSPTPRVLVPDARSAATSW